MRPVTQAFMDAMTARERQVTARVTIDYTDVEIDQSIEASASEQANVSYPAQTADAVSAPTYKWASLDGSCILDGTYHPMPDTPEDAERYQVGWWSRQLAGADGYFAEPYPTLTVTFISRPVHSLRVAGDSARGEWPVDFSIRMYSGDGTLLHEETVTGNTEMDWRKPLDPPITQVTRMELEVRRWSHPGRQAKILEFFTSVQQTYLPGDLLEISLLEEREVSQSTLPVGSISANEITIKLSNEDRRFDADNAQSPLYELLKPNRRIRAWLGVAGDGDGQNLAHVWDAQADWQAGTADRVSVDPVGAVKLARKNYVPNAALVDTDANGIPDGWMAQLTNKIAYSVQPSDQGPYNRLRLDVLQDLTVDDGWPGCEALGVGKELDLGNISGQPVSFRARIRVDNLTTGRFGIWCHWMLNDGTNISADFGSILYSDPKVNAGWFDIVQTRIAPTFDDGRYVRGIRYWRPGAREANAGASFTVEQMQIELSSEPTPFSVSYHGTGTWISQPIDLSPIGQAAASAITWQADTPPGTAVTVEASLDGGQTWLPCENGREIPGILPGTDLTGKSLLVRVTLSTTDTSVTPVLHSLMVEVVHEEWVPLGTFWSTEWQANDDTVEATVVARDRLERLRSSTYQSSQVVQGASLYDLAVMVLSDAGLAPEDYWVDPALQQWTVPYAWFNPVSHREALRIIAEAGLAQVYCDRDGVVRVERQPIGGEPVLDITPDNYFKLNNPMRPNQVANEVIVTTQPRRPVDTPEEVYRSNEPVTIEAGQTVTLTVYYSQPPVIEAAASMEGAPSGVEITGATYYGWGAEVTITNTSGAAASVTLVITGRPLKVQNQERAVARDEASIIENGVLRYDFPANPLVQSLSVAQQIADMVLASAKDPRRDLEIDWRGNPALELGDVVTVKGRQYTIIRQEINWAGALSEVSTGRRVK